MRQVYGPLLVFLGFFQTGFASNEWCDSLFTVQDGEFKYDVHVPANKIIEDEGQYWINIGRLGGKDGEYDLHIEGKSQGSRVVVGNTGGPYLVKSGMVQISPSLARHIRRSLTNPEITFMARKIVSSAHPPEGMTEMKYEGSDLVAGTIDPLRAHPKYLLAAIKNNPRLKITLDKKVTVLTERQMADFYEPPSLDPTTSAQIREHLFKTKIKSEDIPNHDREVPTAQGPVYIQRTRLLSRGGGWFRENDVALAVKVSKGHLQYQPLSPVWVALRKKDGSLIGIYPDQDLNPIGRAIIIPEADLPKDGYTIEFFAL